MRFTDSESANCIAGKIQFYESVCVFAPKSRVSAALHDAEKHLPTGIAMFREIILRSARPIERSSRSFPCTQFGGWRFDAFIDDHDDVGTERDFDLKRFLG